MYRSSCLFWSHVISIGRWFLFFIALTGVAAAQVEDSGSTESAEEAVVRGSDIGRVRMPFERKMLLADPGADGWQTEVVAEAIGKQLKSFAAVLVQDDALDESTIQPIVTDDVESFGLRPAEFRSVFTDDRLLIRRSVTAPAADAPSTSASANGESRGVPQLVEELRDFATRHSLTADSHVELKVVHVDMQRTDAANTEVLLHVTSHAAEQIVQQNATWHCEWSLESDTPRLRRLTVDHVEEIVNRQPQPLFSDCTQYVVGDTVGFQQQLALSHDYWRKRIETHRGITWSGSQGLAIGDANGDGLDDVYVCQPGGLPNRLFVQQPDGKAEEVAKASGVDILDSTASALFLDLDNDGDQDLVLATLTAVVFMKNDGSGTFAVEKSLPVRATPSSMAAADYDNDTLLDVYVCVSRLRGTRAEEDMPWPYHDANNGAPNILFRQVGPWQFQDVTKQVGLDENNHRFSLAAAWEDIDNDGDLDLYVANDYGRNNLYQFDGQRFRDIAKTVGVEDVASGMSVSWGDYNGDGWMDLYVGNMFSAAGNRITYQDAFKQDVDTSTRDLMRRHARGNSLFQNRGDGQFEDVSLSTGVTMGRWAWSSIFFDINNDTRQDIFVANGLATQEDTSDL